ncbi:hypothetical protein [Hymenobacter volaticus]|uniref:Uncharacterized protein n=1 Tax=Hymenobacter volaticus TaxID=2932254 RepID=A0ABY4GGE8_9BACT|nr:hypothetical protein [Hymenobacter volaticus]UOQ69742.1 hypothetical protein MUN86_29975 [Hymenobacter volaticus]
MNAHFVDAFLDGMALLSGRPNQPRNAADRAQPSTRKQVKASTRNCGFLPRTVSVLAVLCPAPTPSTKH